MANSSLLRLAKDRFGLTEAELAQVIGMSRPHVHCVVAGTYAEYLDGKQIRALLDYCRLIRDRAIEGVAELELLA